MCVKEVHEDVCPKRFMGMWVQEVHEDVAGSRGSRGCGGVHDNVCPRSS